MVPLAHGVALPPVCGAGTAYARGKDLEITVAQQPEHTSIRGRAEDVALDLSVRPGGESLSVVVPWSRRRFQYTVKDLGRPVEGTITAGGVEHAVSPADSFAVLDHGRGRWPYSMTWNWAAGSRPGGELGIQLGGRWTEGTGQTENGLIYPGQAKHKPLPGSPALKTFRKPVCAVSTIRRRGEPVPARVTWTSYARPALDCLTEVVAALKQDDPLHPITLVVPSNIAGIVARRHLARRRTAYESLVALGSGRGEPLVDSGHDPH